MSVMSLMLSWSCLTFLKATSSLELVRGEGLEMDPGGAIASAELDSLHAENKIKVKFWISRRN